MFDEFIECARHSGVPAAPELSGNLSAIIGIGEGRVPYTALFDQSRVVVDISKVTLSGPSAVAICGAALSRTGG
jgi:hypothetical protein